MFHDRNIGVAIGWPLKNASSEVLTPDTARLLENWHWQVRVTSSCVCFFYLVGKICLFPIAGSP